MPKLDHNQLPPAVPSQSKRPKRRGTFILVGFLTLGTILAVVVVGFLHLGSKLLQSSDLPMPNPQQIADDLKVEFERKIETAAAVAPPDPEPEPKERSAEEAPAAEIDAEKERVVGNQIFIDHLSLQGIRTDGSNSRLLYEGRLVRIGDYLDRRRGIYFHASAPGELVFQDDQGQQYRLRL